MQKPKEISMSLWNRLNDDQKKLWIVLYRKFLDELNQLSEVQNPVKAHNLTYHAVKEMK